jgi:hypothetical protein
MKPNYLDMGMAHVMGEQLKDFVEKELVKDLSFYNVSLKEYRFDWSASCIEGKCINYLGGTTDIYSGIKIFDENDNFVVEGWMEFIYDSAEDKLIVYWDLLDIMAEGKLERKKKFGIPQHIFDKLSSIALLEVEKYGIKRV